MGQTAKLASRRQLHDRTAYFVMTLPIHPDQEVQALTDMLARGSWLPHEIANIRRQLDDRKAWVEAGLLNSTAIHWTRTLRAELDPLLRVRWDFKYGFMLERWAEGCWNIVGSLGEKQIRADLVPYLRSRDMQAVGAEEWLKRKRADAAKVVEGNEKKSAEKVAAAVDSLSERQVKDFLAVERARHTGETIISHGQDARFMEHVKEVQKVTPAPPADMGPHCMNPGMNPKLQKRKTGGKHIKE